MTRLLICWGIGVVLLLIMQAKLPIRSRRDIAKMFMEKKKKAEERAALSAATAAAALPAATKEQAAPTEGEQKE